MHSLLFIVVLVGFIQNGSGEEALTCPNQHVFPNQILNFTQAVDDWSPDWAMIFENLAFPSAGKVVGWECYSLHPYVTVYASVWRHVGYRRYQLIGREQFPHERPHVGKYETPQEQQIAVERGDVIGLHYATHDNHRQKTSSAIPFAEGPDHLCSNDGHCVEDKDLYDTFVFHRHDEQLAHTKNYIMDFDKMVAAGFGGLKNRRRSPALKPIFCPNNSGAPKSDEQPCHFPFTFEEKNYTTCTTTVSPRAWCAVGQDHTEENWRYCRDGDKFPEQAPCHFPFEYLGHNHTACIEENAARPWCSQVYEYDYSKDWKYCRKVGLELVHDVKVTTTQEAAKLCEEKGLVLAMSRDVESAFEMGVETCHCGWTTRGVAMKTVRSPRKECGEELSQGVHTCPFSNRGFGALCIKA